MDWKGTQSIRAPCADVWKRRNDPATLKACMPGCESYKQPDDGSHEAVILDTLGPRRGVSRDGTGYQRRRGRVVSHRGKQPGLTGKCALQWNKPFLYFVVLYFCNFRKQFVRQPIGPKFRIRHEYRSL
ncbi:hypothetical protein FVF58_34550 [Paraburkholderia panacisoli]|uniref:Uncharacterized protein n=1 Tax=Paraburkholderia panacisoli TaxID=2603818 RepID=A0A5B0GPB9_9BURK|nr:hypothetical protein FVF58_34550 [Paraburkholderia panacisoli]